MGENREHDADLARTHAAAILEFVACSRDVHLLVLDGDGIVVEANHAVLRWLGTDREHLCGTALAEILPSQDAERLDAWIRHGRPDADPVVLNFVDLQGRPYTMQAVVRRDKDRTVVIGAPDAHSFHDLQDRMVEANNQLAELARENERRRRELEEIRAELASTLDELDASFWHLKKIQEVLPICMECGRVKTGDAEWQSVVDYLKENSLFLSHGYCPDCAHVVRARVALELDAPTE